MVGSVFGLDGFGIEVMLTTRGLERGKPVTGAESQYGVRRSELKGVTH